MPRSSPKERSAIETLTQGRGWARGFQHTQLPHTCGSPPACDFDLVCLCDGNCPGGRGTLLAGAVCSSGVGPSVRPGSVGSKNCKKYSQPLGNQ